VRLVEILCNFLMTKYSTYSFQEVFLEVESKKHSIRLLLVLGNNIVTNIRKINYLDLRLSLSKNEILN